jgi:N6-adenosine-specific RNA methylase IME4
MAKLVLYEAAWSALAAAVSVDEVKNIRDRALAMQMLAKQVRDSELIDKATELRLRAERRLGEMIIAQKETVGLATGAAGIGKSASAVPEEYRTQPPTLASAGIDKKLSASAQKIAAMPASAFEAHLSATQKQAFDALRKTTAEKQARRAERETELAGKILALPDKKYGVILEDFEWDHETWSEAGKDRHASNHYLTSSDAHTATEIVERTKERFLCAAKDCVLFMWTTQPHLAIAIDVLRLRGFVYKSNAIWGKDRKGTGYWFNNKHEQLLVGVRGNVPCPAPGEQWDSLIVEPRGRHSEKPEIFYGADRILFPQSAEDRTQRSPASPGLGCVGAGSAKRPGRRMTDIVPPARQRPALSRFVARPPPPGAFGETAASGAEPPGAA